MNMHTDRQELTVSRQGLGGVAPSLIQAANHAEARDNA